MRSKEKLYIVLALILFWVLGYFVGLETAKIGIPQEELNQIAAQEGLTPYQLEQSIIEITPKTITYLDDVEGQEGYAFLKVVLR